ncbi:hypothetical protein R5M92_05235 [Halomonas sp. Bachu 37]|uniref:hypothetical protein n=1 Tax=Halomonas kashgarensis TaxID=3084920 RepID=UPI003217363F
MSKIRRYADLIASMEGLMWLMLGWSISVSLYRESLEPTLAAGLAVGTVIFTSWAHRPLRLTMRRYHVRKRRTDMWVHVLALPVLLAMAIYLVMEALLGSAWLQKMLLINLMASAGWLVFVLTLALKGVAHSVKNSATK